MPPEVRSPWIVCPEPNPRAERRLLCFPYAGKGASLFRTWPAALPGILEVIAIQLPGREGRLREPPISDMHTLIERLLPAVAPFLDRPYAVFGHSLGALVGFELARALRRAGLPLPSSLLVSARRAPQLPEERPPIAGLPVPEFLQAIRRRYDGIPAAVLEHPDLLALLVPALRADVAMLEAYRYAAEPPLGCPITALAGSRDREAPAPEVGAWRAQTCGEFQLQLLPGDHFFLQTAQAALLATVERALVHEVGRGVEAA
jgi:medium-chain acyl-[acyl-carrier-protein] hydrolase